MELHHENNTSCHKREEHWLIAKHHSLSKQSRNKFHPMKWEWLTCIPGLAIRTFMLNLKNALSAACYDCSQGTRAKSHCWGNLPKSLLAVCRALQKHNEGERTLIVQGCWRGSSNNSVIKWPSRSLGTEAWHFSRESIARSRWQRGLLELLPLKGLC